MIMKNHRFISKKDGYLLLAVVFLCGILLAILWLHKIPGDTLVITIDGAVYGSYDLSRDQTIPITRNNDQNTVSVKNGVVSMEQANCPDQYCVHHASIKSEGELIVCLPHKLVLEIVKSNPDPANSIDTVSE